jgi:hypothetical protein
MAEAETAHGAKNYSDARYSLQQALMGIEIQLGRQILKSLPPAIVSVPADTLQDKGDEYPMGVEQPEHPASVSKRRQATNHYYWK